MTLLTCTVRVPPSIRAASTATRRARAKPRILEASSLCSSLTIMFVRFWAIPGNSGAVKLRSCQVRNELGLLPRIFIYDPSRQPVARFHARKPEVHERDDVFPPTHRDVSLVLR